MTPAAVVTEGARPAGSAGPTSAGVETVVGDVDAGHEMGVICVDVVCPYTRALVLEGLARRRGAWRVTTDRYL